MGEYLSQRDSPTFSNNEKEFLKKQKENEFYLKNLKNEKENIRKKILKKYFNYQIWAITGIVLLFLFLLFFFLLTN